MPINVRALVPIATKAKNVATEVYVDNEITTVNESINNVEQAVTNANDALAVQLGYTDYSSLVAAAAQGNTIISGGYVKTELIDASALTVNSVSVNEGATGAHLSINNNVIKAYDANGTLRVKLGDLSA